MIGVMILLSPTLKTGGKRDVEFSRASHIYSYNLYIYKINTNFIQTLD